MWGRFTGKRGVNAPVVFGNKVYYFDGEEVLWIYSLQNGEWTCV